MIRVLSVALMFTALSVTTYAKDQAIERRKEACHKLSMYLEQNTGWDTYVRIAPGKSQNVMQLLPGMSNGKLQLLDGGAQMRPEAMVRFKREVVDTLLLAEPYKSQLKQLGFTAIQIKIA